MRGRCEGDKLATMGVVTCCEGCSNMLDVHTSICFELCCLIVGESFFQSTYPAERFMLNGKVTVVLKGVSVIV